ncbi:type I DNA topoisomerase [Pseudomonas protegens]|uniref:DNA topoisomerase 1 n=1 Tax=Pseudomonas protegens TaxID=380021 RepID=A0A2T6GB35_9PSED|nr:type I DNA topoisomerase [Pseudomonas protegens]PUA41364.1 type I DNA topoisomerase [Pseudomonas protegens]
MKLMIIEAPGKLKKLRPLLQKLRPREDWQVVASGGHIRDLPAKGKDDSMITVGVRKNYTPVYEILKESVHNVATLKAAVKQASVVYLATDLDREGESISWHIQQVLGLKDYHRITFNDLTPQRVRDALEQPRQIDLRRVASQECRRVLDRLVGYLVTEELRRVMGKPTTAGRVQSPALYLVVLREREIRAFVVVQHFGVRLHFPVPGRETACTWFADWQPVPDFATPSHPYVQDLALTQQVAAVSSVAVESCEDRKAQRQPPAPFITSSLQQAASNALKWSPKKTMQVAQRLYEQAAITYHRTDNPNLPEEAMPDIRAAAHTLGLATVEQRRTFKAAEGAQEGHPAITPTEWTQEVAGENPEEQALYRLIRIRALACQLEAAIYDVRAVKLLAIGPERRPLRFAATGRTLVYPGWLKLLQSDDTVDKDEQSNPAEANNPIPPLTSRQMLTVQHGETQEKKTLPPARYTEASLVKELERRGIGRPSSFASIVSNITARGLVELKHRKLVPGSLGEETIAHLEGTFSFLELDFTREMETDLDRIAQGQDSYAAVIARFHQRLEAELQKQRALPCVPMQAASSHSVSSTSSASAPSAEYRCGKCDKPLQRRQKKGKDGYDFWGCTSFRDGCKVTYPSLKGKPDFDKPRGL